MYDEVYVCLRTFFVHYLANLSTTNESNHKIVVIALVEGRHAATTWLACIWPHLALIFMMQHGCGHSMHFDDGKTIIHAHYRSVLSEASSSANLKKICNRLEVLTWSKTTFLDRITWDIIQRCPRFRAQKEFLDPIYYGILQPKWGPIFWKIWGPIKYAASQPVFPPLPQKKRGRRHPSTVGFEDYWAGILR